MLVETKEPSELQKLKNMAEMIKESTCGRMEIRPGVLNDVYIHPEDSAYVGIELSVRPDWKAERYELSFSARVRRMGDVLDAAGLNDLLRELQAAHAVLASLERCELHPTQEDMEAFRDFLIREQRQSAPEQSGPVLGQTI